MAKIVTKWAIIVTKVLGICKGLSTPLAMLLHRHTFSNLMRIAESILVSIVAELCKWSGSRLFLILTNWVKIMPMQSTGSID